MAVPAAHDKSLMDCFVYSADLAHLVEAWLVGFASGCRPVLSLRGVKSRVPRESNLIFGGTGVSPVILIDGLEACPATGDCFGLAPSAMTFRATARPQTELKAQSILLLFTLGASGNTLRKKTILYPPKHSRQAYAPRSPQRGTAFVGGTPWFQL